jgi:hypothetical protein
MSEGENGVTYYVEGVRYVQLKTMGGVFPCISPAEINELRDEIAELRARLDEMAKRAG